MGGDGAVGEGDCAGLVWLRSVTSVQDGGVQDTWEECWRKEGDEDGEDVEVQVMTAFICQQHYDHLHDFVC